MGGAETPINSNHYQLTIEENPKFLANDFGCGFYEIDFLIRGAPIGRVNFRIRDCQ